VIVLDELLDKTIGEKFIDGAQDPFFGLLFIALTNCILA
jgi:hypothetical protein